MNFRSPHLFLFLALAASSCAPTIPSGPAAEFEEVPAAEFVADLANGDTPTVVNVWASWCLPCRAEAPLLAQASSQFAGQVTFIGIDVKDRMEPAAEFVAEFGLDFVQVFDPDSSIPAILGGVGVPITYFVDADGEIVKTHIGIIDERTLASGIDQLLDG